MSTLTGKTVADTYKDVLHVSNNNEGISVDADSATYIHDGSGGSSILGLTTTAVHVSGGIEFARNATYSIGSATHRASELHVNQIKLNGVTLTGDPSEEEILINGNVISKATHSTMNDPTQLIGKEPLTELQIEGTYTLPDGEYVGQTKIITTTGDETDDVIIVPDNFASGAEITFKSQPGLRQSVSLVFGTAGWVVTGKSDIFELANRGPIVT